MKKIVRLLNFITEKRFGNSILSDLKLHLSKRQNGGKTNLIGKTTYFVDGRNFITCRREIFRDNAYAIPIPTSINNPVIIDCGANIGLGIIYLKQLIPDSHILAFEPDLKNNSVLEQNISSHKLQNVQVFQKAVWINNNGIKFLSSNNMESRIIQSTDEYDNSTIVPSIRLKEVLQEYSNIYFLKIDIEGAEDSVIEDCKDDLHRCNFLFIEYHSISGKKQNLQRILETIRSNGFRYHIKEASSSGNLYSNEKNLGHMDFQLNIFCRKAS